MNNEIKNECYLLSLEGYQNKDIAKKLNVSPATVTRAINSVVMGNDYQLAIKGCSKLLEEFVRYQDFCKKKLSQLSDLKTEDNKEVVMIIKAQSEIYRDLLTLGAQGEFIQSVKRLRDETAALEGKNAT